jgi:hypothetical protein
VNLEVHCELVGNGLHGRVTVLLYAVPNPITGRATGVMGVPQSVPVMVSVIGHPFPYVMVSWKLHG